MFFPESFARIKLAKGEMNVSGVNLKILAPELHFIMYP